MPIYSPPHRNLNTSRGIIRYIDEDLDDLSDEEICEELAPQDVIHVKRFILKRNGQTVKLNTFLITFNFPTIWSSIRIGLYNAKVSPYVPNPVSHLSVRNSDMVKASVKGNLNVLSVQRKTTRASIVITPRSAPIVVNLTWLHRKIVNISWKKKISKS